MVWFIRLAVAAILVSDGANAVQPRCRAPGELQQTLRIYEKSPSPSFDPPNVRGIIAKCLRIIYRLLEDVCESMLNTRRHIPVRFSRRFNVTGWRHRVDTWARMRSIMLHQWSLKHPECTAPSVQARLSGLYRYVEDYSAQVRLVATRPAAEARDGASAVLAFTRFLDSYSLMLYFLVVMQTVILPDQENDMANELHKFRRLHANSSRPRLPAFRLNHKTFLVKTWFIASVITDAIRNQVQRGRRLRFVEIGVWKGNTSISTWKRVSRLPGEIEMHLVDHWGESWVNGKVLVSALGSGSDMAGSSNTSIYKRLLRQFSKTGRCVQVPYWLPRHVAREDGDIYFHRTTTVNAARQFDDGSLDVVYLDADHKWWSVLQDLAVFWPKVRPGGVMLGHDFHLNGLWERPEDDTNHVPISVVAFFRAPLEVVLHSGFVWEVRKPRNGNYRTAVDFELLCNFIRHRMFPHSDFEICA